MYRSFSTEFGQTTLMWNSPWIKNCQKIRPLTSYMCVLTGFCIKPVCTHSTVVHLTSDRNFRYNWIRCGLRRHNHMKCSKKNKEDDAFVASNICPNINKVQNPRQSPPPKSVTLRNNYKKEKIFDCEWDKWKECWLVC